MFYRDHNPPHFHAEYRNDEALVDIHTLEIIKGALPKRARSLFIEWAVEHRDELSKNWERVRKPENLEPIEPLD